MAKIIARISNGFGNQMFMYAASYAIAKDLGRELELDIVSGINSLKNKNKFFKHFDPKFELGIFNIGSKIAKPEHQFNGTFKNLKRKILIFFDGFFREKSFIIEHRNNEKKTFYKQIDGNIYTKDHIYIEGYFESDKYFKKYRNELINEFSFKKKINCVKEFEDQISNSNSVCLSIRSDRYNEKKIDDRNILNIIKSKNFEKKQYNYIIRAIDFFKFNLKKPKFFLFSDNHNKIKHHFENTDVTLVNKFLDNKIHEDYYLMSLCKHFAVSPTTFSFWPAWLSQNKNKICLKPKNINVSDNLDFWPDDWLEI